VQKILRVAKHSGVDLVTLSGGVSCNRALCSQLERACREQDLRFRAASAWLSTDNAAMIAFAASLHLNRGIQSDVRQEIDPNLALV
jgi:N6-L-threonylcarbamoyladenine synthase